MRKLIVLICILAACWIAACSKNSSSPVENSTVRDNRHAVPRAGGMAEAIKGKTLDGFSSVTIGTAFDGYAYFAKKEWKETTPQNGKIYVDFIGWLAADSLTAESMNRGVSGQGVDVKFVINPDGSFFVGMISKIESGKDGAVYAVPLAETQPILEQIYGGRKIRF